MRRTNYAYQPLSQNPSTSSGSTTTNSGPSTSYNALEDENNMVTEELSEKIGALKSLSIDIGNEVKYHSKLLNGMDDDMDRTHGFLTNTMNRVIRLGKHGGNKYMCYMFLFILFVFFILYIVIKIK